MNIEFCNKCSRRGDGKGFIKAEITGNDILVLGEQPGYEELKANRPFVGPSGKILRSVLSGITNKYIIDNAVRCLHQFDKPTKAHINKCRQCWVDLVTKYKPKVIIALGAYAAQSVLQQKTAISTKVGQMESVNINGQTIPVIYSYHPSYLLRSEGNKDYRAIQDKWFGCWELVESILKKGIPSLPKVRHLIKYLEIKNYLQQLLYSSEKFAYDYEVIGDVDAKRPELNRSLQIVCIGVATVDGAVCFPLDHREMVWQGDQQRDIVRLWNQIIRNGWGIAQNAKYEHKCNFLRFGGSALLRDTMLRMHCIDETAGCNLGAIAGWAGLPWAYYKTHYQDVPKSVESVELGELLTYCGLDALATYESEKKLTEVIEREGQGNIVAMQESFAYFLAQVELIGMHIDPEEVTRLRVEINSKIVEMEDRFQSRPEVLRVRKWAVENIKTFKDGDLFNPKSRKQMERLCFDELKLPIQPDSKGMRSLDKDHLAPYIDKYPAIGDMNQVRSYSAMLNGFLNKWDESLGPHHCVHTQYNQAIVVTGRLSSSNPNLQNIPVHSIVRRAFDSRYDDGYLVSADYSQLEPIILAGWSGDQSMCKAINEKLDLHRWVASVIYKVDYDDVTKEQRRRGKTLNLGQMYGQTEYGLSQAIDVSLKEAKKLIDGYNSRFPGIARFRQGFHREAIHKGYVEDLFGARRHLPNARSSDHWESERALRQAGNYSVQSTGNRFCLLALCRCIVKLRQRQLRAVIIGTVHDSIIMDVDVDNLKLAIAVLKDSMLIHNQMWYWKNKPTHLEVDVHIGRNLYEMVSESEFKPQTL